MHCGAPRRNGELQPYYFLPRSRLGIDANGLYLIQDDVDAQIPQLLDRIHVDSALVPELREHYARNIRAAVEEKRGQWLKVLRRQLTDSRETERGYARLWAQGRLSDQAFDELAVEVHSDIARIENTINQVKRGSETRIRDLDQAVRIVNRIPAYWPHLKHKEQRQLLQLLFKEIQVDLSGKVLPSPLHAPFAYLVDEAMAIMRGINNGDGAAAPSPSSGFVPLGTPERT